MEALKTYVDNLIFYFKIDLSTQQNFKKDTFHLDYENKVYRQEDLVRLIRDAVPYFALTPEEFKEYIRQKNTIDLHRDAWSRISKARKDKKGDYGELLLYLILISFYDAEKFVTKVRLRTSIKEQVKGYDCAHFTIENNEPILWLGEAKFHQSFTTALSSAISSVEEHCQTTYLKEEISILKANIEINKHKDFSKLGNIFKGKSIDRIKIRVPILLTYDSTAVKNNFEISNKFKEDLENEILMHCHKIEEKTLNCNSNFDFLFIIFPLHTVMEIKDRLDIIEEGNR